jgi:hypothetical protein
LLQPQNNNIEPTTGSMRARALEHTTLIGLEIQFLNSGRSRAFLDAFGFHGWYGTIHCSAVLKG